MNPISSVPRTSALWIFLKKFCTTTLPVIVPGLRSFHHKEDSMIIPWAIGGAIVGGIIGIFNDGIFPGIIVGAIAGIALRKWLFRTFWQ
jgi:hypothetical protein